MERQGQDLARRLFRHREVAGLAAEVGEGGLQMQGDRVVDEGADPAGPKALGQGVAARMSDHEEMVHRFGVGFFRGKDEPCPLKAAPVDRGELPPGGGS